MRALEISNIETVIIFRSCTPIAVSVCDHLFLGRELPSRRSSLALLIIAAGEERRKGGRGGGDDMMCGIRKYGYGYRGDR